MLYTLLPVVLASLFVPDIIIYKIFVKRRTKNSLVRALWWMPSILLTVALFVLISRIDWEERGLLLPYQILSETFTILWVADFGPKISFCLLYGLQQWYANYKPSIKKSRWWHPYAYASIPSFIGFFMIIGGVVYGFRHIVIKEVELSLEEIPESFDGYRIAQFSDLHLGTYKVYAEDVPARLRDRINEVNADLIVFTGDIVNNRANELDGFENQLKGMKAKDGIYAIMGNHDYSTYIYWKSAEKRKENIRNLQDRMGAQGWKWLLNQHKIIRRGQDSIALIGVENDGNPHFPALADLPKATEGLERPMFKILLSHDPTHWRREVLDSTDIQLQLSGHTHGMQLELFGLSPAKLIYPDWGGWYNKGKRWLYVSTGVGGVVYPFRFGAWPEIVVITLRHKKE